MSRLMARNGSNIVSSDHNLLPVDLGLSHMTLCEFQFELKILLAVVFFPRLTVKLISSLTPFSFELSLKFLAYKNRVFFTYDFF